MVISDNKVVTLHYSLRESGKDGDLIEETFGEEPLVYLHGHGTMIPGFEKQLEGKKVGDAYEFTLNPEEAYGSIDQDSIVEVPLENFANEEGEVDREAFEVGAPINMSDDEGNHFQGFISELKENSVIVDFNHPMAGLYLHFSGEIVEVREASSEELDHGHVHGPGGHHH
jgi:FKBP-type peptidyl-prolyl cis-trans isomerase SlyD